MQALVRGGHRVRVFDDNSRGAPRRLKTVEKDIEFIAGDIRDAKAVEDAVRGMDEVHHLAYVNGTEFFYSAPELVLEVGVKGMINVLDACRSADVRSLVPFGKGVRADMGQSRGAQSGEADRHAVWLAAQNLEPKLSPFDPGAMLDEIQRLVPGYEGISRLNLFAGGDVHTHSGSVERPDAADENQDRDGCTGRGGRSLNSLTGTAIAV